MKLQGIRRYLLALVCLLAGWTVSADEPAKIEEAVRGMVDKYENVEGVESEVFVKGQGLELVKMMLKKQFGKEFMKAVNCIIIIDYTEAGADTCQAMRKDVESLSNMLEEVNLREGNDLEDSDYLKSLVDMDDHGNISTYLVQVEDDESKIIMYMAGAISFD